ncbi:MAG: outer membrane beta-barrel protein [Chitinophagaceae bacterium]|nr:outer membrane beta-barrel protein [Chitinophagaceae bacterium]
MKSYRNSFWGLVLATFVLQAKAQVSIGLDAGITRNSPDIALSNRALTAIRPGYGYALGLNVVKSISHCLFFAFLPSLQQKNFSIIRTGEFKGIYMRYESTYFQLPLLLQYCLKSLAGRVFYSIEMGGYYGYWLAGRDKGKIPDIFGVSNRVNSVSQTEEEFQLTYYNEPHYFDSRVDQRVEWGWVVGGGIHYSLNKQHELFLVTRFYQSLTSQQKSSPDFGSAQYNRVLSLTLGYLIVLNGK